MKSLKYSKIQQTVLNLFTLLACILCMAKASISQVVVNSNTRWIDTHINVSAGSLVQLSATGTVNVGGGRGSYGPIGILGTHTAAFPTDLPYIYGLVARLTSSPTSPYDELRVDWAYGSQTSYCSNAPGHLWLAVNDDNLVDNTGAFNVAVTLGNCTLPGYTYRSTRIHVVNEWGIDIEGSDIYINGIFRGRSNNQGMLLLPAQNPGSEIIARKLIRENSSYRRYHDAGSANDWNYRVYNTSMTVNNDGTFTNTIVTEPNTAYTVTIRSSNTLIVPNYLYSSIIWQNFNS